MNFNFTKGSLFRGIGIWSFLFCGLSLFGTEYYVDPLGDDAHDGSTPAKAWRTLAHAMTIATTSGDIVHAAPGVYNEGVMSWTNSNFPTVPVLNRVIIPAGVGLIADQGRAVTKIVGARDPNTWGCGPDAVRCVRLNANAWIRDFTISEGFTVKNKTPAGANINNSSVSGGGGVYAADGTATVVDCEIYGNQATYRGCAVVNASLLRCYVHGNTCADSCQASILGTDTSKIFDCYIDESADVRNVTTIVNSTLMCQAYAYGGATRYAYNCYFKSTGAGTTFYLYNCAMGGAQSTSEKYHYSNCQFNLGSKNLFDSSRRPFSSVNELINQGDNAYYTDKWNSSWDKFGQSDFAGGARFVNETIDIGAGEYQGEEPPPPTPAPKGTVFALHGRRVDPSISSHAIATRGAASDWSIVIPENCAPSEFQAAIDLYDGIRLTTEVRLPIIKGTNPTQGIFIKIVNDAQLGEDGFRLKMEGRRLRITGGKRGVLYGVYELLERYAGCDWYAAWFSDYPTCHSITIPIDLDETQVPTFDMRDSSSYFSDASFAAHQRMNGIHKTFDVAHGGESPYRFASSLGSCHTVLSIVKLADYKSTHPEYFAMRNGARYTSSDTQLCLTNPEVLELAIKFVVNSATNNPSIKFFGVSQADNQNYCECPSCLASYDTYGQSGTILNFVNPIADEVKKVRPDAWVETLAYQYSRRPPLGGVVPRDNVMICFCSIESEFGRPFRDSDSETGGYANNIYFKEDIAVWRQIAKRIYIWDYACNFHHYPFPFLDFGAIQPNLQFFHENGVRQVFEQGSGGGTANWYGDLRIYLFSKLLWNPYVNLEPYKNKFFNTYYGSAASLIRKDFEAFSALPVGGAAKPIKIYADIETSIIPDQIFADSTERWLQATELVKNDRPEVQRAVKIGLFCMDYSSVRRYAEQLEDMLPIVFTTDENEPNYQRLLRMNEAARRALAAMAADSTLRLSEGDDRNQTNKEYINLFATYEVPTTNQNVFIIPADDIKNHREANKATKVSLDGMTGTFVWELDGSHKNWMFRVESNRFVDKPDSTYNVYVRLRVEGLAEDDPKDGDGYKTGLNLWNTKLNTEDGDNRPKVSVRDFAAAEKDEYGFAWVMVRSNWTPTSGQYVSMGPGYFTGVSRNPAFQKLQFDAVKVERISD